MTTTKDEFLKLLSGDEEIIINACDGRETIASATDVFPSGTSFDFRDLLSKTNSCASTNIAPVQVYEMTQEATLLQLFNSLSTSTDLNDLCLTQHQIKLFCKDCSNWLLKGGCGTFFLFKIDGVILVALVFMFSDGLFIAVYDIECKFVWDIKNSHRRVVVPKLPS